ncbi:GntR family transcriptional regulator [Phyllobacterium brassicacearum]|uniref:GntR family transcriptional regulator n=1 Tax=Phyllobacterium brassicacearum TaxID=314235 RepID=A0A2P7BVM1_9HYPH|nr:GntR family transcriptional regulator [Phyllobacterium brassicacearum]PSH70472.1 GntR family transcriptional regulator [Phyllobacterium brassicacearum]TDQ28126.1 GntR family transcriptional regulator [Phyllobacterium brassicacearum]
MANIAPSGDTRLIDRNHPDPLYVQLRIILRERIDRKELSVNDKLPSERELVEMYGVSRITVRQAIKDLENLGFLQTRAGKGIYVAKPKPTYEIEIVRSFTETAEANNRKPGMRLLCSAIIQADLDITRPLALPSGSNVVFIERLRFLDDLPVVVQRDWFAEAIAPGILDIDWAAGNRSLYAEFNDRYGVVPTRGQSTLSARLASELEAQLLQLELPAAVLTLDQISYDNEYRPVNVSAMAYHPVRYPLSLTQSRRRV